MTCRSQSSSADRPSPNLGGVLDSISDGVFLIDRDWRFAYLNRSAKELLGHRDLVGCKLWDEFPAEAVQSKSKQMYSKVMEERIAVEFEDYAPSLDRWYEVRAYPDESGGVAVVFRDVTEKKHLHDRLAESESRYYATFNQAAVGIANVGLDGRWIEVNQKLCDIVGYPREELLKLTFQDITHPDDLTTDEALYAKLKAGEIPQYTLEKRYFHHSGQIVWINLTVSMIRDTTGTPVQAIAIVEDITDRRRADAALRDSEERARDTAAQLRLALESAQSGTFEVDLGTGVVQWSPELEKLYGMVPGQFAGTIEDWLPRVYEEDRAMMLAKYHAFVKEGGSLVLEFRIRRQDNDEVRWIEARSQLLRDRNGRRTRMIGVNADVTERIHARQSLEESERHFRTLVNASPLIIWTALPDGTQDFANSRWYEFVGIMAPTKAEAWREICHPEDIEKTAECWTRARLNREPYHCLHRIRRHDGEYRWMLTKAFPQLDKEGKIQRWVGTGTDVTELKQAEEARVEAEALMRQSEERLRIATTAAELGILDLDLRTNELATTPRTNEIFGFPPDRSVTYADYEATVHPDDIAARRALLAKTIADRSDYDAEYRVIWPDGSIHWVSSRGRAYYDEQGTPVRFSGVVADITARKELERALIRSEKLASVGRMAATIAHEINNPLAAVTNLLYLASVDPQLPDSAQAFVRSAQQELERAAHITKQTLGFYRETGRPQTVDLPELIDGVLDLYQPRLMNRSVRLERDYSKQTNAFVIAGELRQVVSNMIANAIDALPDVGGRLLLRTRKITANGSSMIRLTIADNGSGISPESQKRIFEPFFTTKIAVGTGLGLWVSRDIVARSGGVIRVRSREGRGSVFSVWLPIQSPPIAA